MKINKKHKAYAVILGVAFSALGVNFTFGGPSTADAMPAVAEVAQSAASTAPQAMDARYPSLASQLRSLGGENANVGTLNPFAPSAAWAACKPVSAITQPAADFQAAHHLSAIALGAKTGQAIINGRLVRLGQTVDGYRLIGISKNAVRFADATNTVELKLNSEMNPVQAATN